MIHKITYSALILIILILGVFAYIKANEAEKQTILAMESVVRAEAAQAQAQQSAARAIEEGARADIISKEAEKQRAIASVYEEQAKLSRADVEVAAEYKMIAEQQRARTDRAMRLEAEGRRKLFVVQNEAEKQKTAAELAKSAAEMQRFEAMKLMKRADSLEAELRKLKN